MNRFFSWFSSKNYSKSFTSNASLRTIKASIEGKQTKEFLASLRSKEDQIPCINTFFDCLSTVSDQKYMSELFGLIKSKSRLNANELSSLVCKKLARAILEKNFDLCEQILRLPLPAATLPLPTYELTQLIHRCPDREQLLRCLSILIKINLHYDPTYVPWLLIIIFEDYIAGDEHTIEYLLNKHPEKEFLHSNYGENNLTPLMLFLHIYTTEKCQIIIDKHLSTLSDQSVLFRRDRWNRSYLTHLLCGHCRHPTSESPFDTSRKTIDEWNEIFHSSCPHAASVLSTFNLFYRLGNRCENPIRTILNSGYCLPLQFLLIHYLLEQDSMIQINCEEFFQCFPPRLIRTHMIYLSELIQKKNLNSTLYSILQLPTNTLMNHYDTIEFLLRRGAQLDSGKDVSRIIINILRTVEVAIPHLLLDYRIHLNPSTDIRTLMSCDKLTLYIGRMAYCGYRLDFSKYLDVLKPLVPEAKFKLVEEFLGLRKPPRLSRLCYQKIRSSVKNLGEETVEQLNEHIPVHLRSPVMTFKHDNYQKYSKLIDSSP